MKKIKLTWPYPTLPIIKQSPGLSGRWGDCQFYINQDIAEYDYWVVFNELAQPQETAVCPRGNTILLTGEPATTWRYDRKFVNQFAKVITSQRQIRHPGVIHTFQGHPWHVGLDHSNPDDLGLARNYDELIAMESVPKSKLVSIISSNKQGTAGHRQRYKFALTLKEALGDQADLYGRGFSDFNDKWDVLAPYKYSIAIENCSTPDYITEKLFDCFLAHTFPFYYGAPNAGRYFLPESFCSIDINNPAGAIEVIKRVINDAAHYETHLAAVKAAKLQYLNHYNIFPLIAELIADWPDSGPKEQVALVNGKFTWCNRWRIFGDKLQSTGARIFNH